jgi:hypothetical protein
MSILWGMGVSLADAIARFPGSARGKKKKIYIYIYIIMYNIYIL